MKKLLSFIVSSQLVFSVFSLFPPADAYAVQKEGQLNNIVLFAQFKDPDEYNFMESYTDRIVKICNDEENQRSLTSYIKAISYDNLNVKSYFPQMKDGVIMPYQLQHSESEYMNCEQYAFEMIKNIDIPDDISLDGNSDGIVDNITLIIDGSAENSESPIWSKKFTLFGTKLNGLDVSTFNIHNSKQLFENIISGGEGVICHEFLHSIGYPDLYRHTRTGTPVGMWDIMASNSVFLQYPLAYMRASVSGWLDYKEITTDGTYTLSPASESKGDRLYILKTPLSDTEFFAVEYRRQGARYSNELDTKIYGSGLCIYRVNTEQDGNFNSDHDQIYVFRPGETTLDAGEGDLSKSCYGGENAPDSVGSLDLSATVADGALVYSNGTNSGIYINNITISGDELTFNVEFADTATAELWETINTSALGGLMPCQLAESPDGTVYMVATDNKKSQLYRIEENNIIAVGGALNAGNMYNIKTALCENTQYIMYHDNDYKIHICRLDIEKNKWNEIYAGSQLAQYVDITSDGKKIYFSYTEGSFPYILKVASYDPATDTITDLNCPATDNVCNISMSFADNKLIVGYRSITDGNTPKLAIFDNSGWNTEKLSDRECSGVSVASDGKKAVITPWGSGCDLYTFENNKNDVINIPDEMTEKAFIQIPAVSGESIYTAVNTQNPDKLMVYRYNGSDWSAVGDITATEIVNELSLVSAGGYVYCSYYTSNKTPVLKRLKVSTSEKISGDVNADGVFNIADAVAVQNFILNKGTLTDWQTGDLNNDNRIDSFDLCLMRKNLLI